MGEISGSKANYDLAFVVRHSLRSVPLLKIVIDRKVPTGPYLFIVGNILYLMALAATHILIPIIILDLLRHYYLGLKKFPRYLLLIGGIAGLAPDIDIPLTWLTHLLVTNNVDFHGTFTHSFFFVVIFFVLGTLFQWRNNKKWSMIFYVIAFGWFCHLFLDWLYGEYKTLFWPFAVTPWTIFPTWTLYTYGESIDAILLVLWLVHQELHNYIKDYF